MSWQDVVKEALQEHDGAYDALTKALKGANIKLQDVGSGDYVSVNKYNDEVKRLQKEIEDTKNAPNPLQSEMEALKKTHAEEIQKERGIAANIIKAQAVSEKIASLGIKNELEAVGIKSLVKLEDIKMDDNYKITGGLDEQIDSLKETYKDSFANKSFISTGMSVPSSASIGTSSKQYKSIDEIKALSQAEVDADYANIMSQIGNLK